MRATELAHLGYFIEFWGCDETVCIEYGAHRKQDHIGSTPVPWQRAVGSNFPTCMCLLSGRPVPQPVLFFTKELKLPKKVLNVGSLLSSELKAVYSSLGWRPRAWGIGYEGRASFQKEPRPGKPGSALDGGLPPMVAQEAKRSTWKAK